LDARLDLLNIASDSGQAMAMTSGTWSTDYGLIKDNHPALRQHKQAFIGCFLIDNLTNWRDRNGEDNQRVIQAEGYKLESAAHDRGVQSTTCTWHSRTTKEIEMGSLRRSFLSGNGSRSSGTVLLGMGKTYINKQRNEKYAER